MDEERGVLVKGLFSGGIVNEDVAAVGVKELLLLIEVLLLLLWLLAVVVWKPDDVGVMGRDPKPMLL